MVDLCGGFLWNALLTAHWDLWSRVGEAPDLDFSVCLGSRCTLAVTVLLYLWGVYAWLLFLPCLSAANDHRLSLCCLSVSICVYLCLSISVYLSICLSVCVYLSLSNHISLYLSLSLYPSLSVEIFVTVSFSSLLAWNSSPVSHCISHCGLLCSWAVCGGGCGCGWCFVYLVVSRSLQLCLVKIGDFWWCLYFWLLIMSLQLYIYIIPSRYNWFTFFDFV